MSNFNELEEQAVSVSGVNKPKPLCEDLDSYYKTLGDGEQEYLGIRTGLNTLDKKTLGLDGLIVLGGVAGQGKTSLSLQLAFGACELGTPVLFYSLEMPKRAIFTKILNRLSGVSYFDILLKGRSYLDKNCKDKNLLGENIDTRKLLEQKEAEKLKEAQGKMEEVGEKFYVRTRENGEGLVTFGSVEEEINLLKAEHKTEKVLVVIDHLQVFTVGNYKDQIDKENKLMSGLKEISDRTGSTIILISQKNKAGFTTKGLQTIKGSVDIVYLADVVMFLEEEKKSDKELQMSDIDASIDDYCPPIKDINLVIDKNRHNSPTRIKLEFKGADSSFKEKEY